MYKAILTILIILTGCSSSGPDLSRSDTLRIPLNILSGNWLVVSETKESEWGTSNAFYTQFTSYDLESGLLYWFTYYNSSGSAINAMERYRNRIFYNNIDGEDIWISLNYVISSILINVDMYDFCCTTELVDTESTQLCSAFLHYNQCNMLIASNSLNDQLALSEFVDVINYVDKNIDQVQICQP